MLPFVYSMDHGQQEQNPSNQAAPSYGVDFLTDFYRNYEESQKAMQNTQHERLRQREEETMRQQGVESAIESKSQSGSPSHYQSRSRRSSEDRHRSRSRERRRSRDRYHRSRSRSKSRERRRHRGRSRSPKRRSRSRSWDRDRRRDDRDYQAAAPSNKLAMMSLPNDVSREMITMVMAADGFTPNDVRVVNRGTGRCFGFIDFADVDNAINWMEYNKGWLTLNDGRRIAVNYAKPDPASIGRANITSSDWICANCTCNNFFKRDKCFKCETSKATSDEMERAGMHMIGVVPCDTILIRNLPAGVTTSSIFEGLIRNVNLSIIIQLQLSDSKQYAYIQMRTPDDALALFNSSYKNPIKVMNQDAIMTYCKLPLKEIMRQEQLALNAASNQPLPLPSTGQPISGAEVAHAAMMRLAQNRGDITPQPKTQHQYYRPSPAQIPVPASTAQKPGVIGTTQTPHGILPKYAVPNPTTFIFDQSTGYFRDPITGFLYDPKSGYYFMQDNNVWACWDATYETYFNMSGNSGEAKQESAESLKKTETEKKAANAMKEMQKWQKKQEKQKLQITLKPLGKGLDNKSVFESQETSDEIEENQTSKKDKYSDSDEEDEKEDAPRKNSSDTQNTQNKAADLERMEREWIDETRKVCRLCNRAFPSIDVLQKHAEKSDLHKKNAEEKRAEWKKQFAGSNRFSTDEQEPEQKIVYRDRARERRAQFGLDGGYGKEERHEPYAPRTSETAKKDAEIAANKPLDSNNIGNKLLRNMGWKEGEGAGKYGQGIVNPIEAVRRVQGAGLGSSGSTVVHSSEATQKERIRASMLNRFREIRDQ